MVIFGHDEIRQATSKVHFHINESNFICIFPSSWPLRLLDSLFQRSSSPLLFSFYFFSKNHDQLKQLVIFRRFSVKINPFYKTGIKKDPFRGQKPTVAVNNFFEINYLSSFETVPSGAIPCFSNIVLKSCIERPGINSIMRI